MILDAQTQLWDAVALSGDAVSTNGYDTGLTAGIDFAVGQPICAIITVDVAADSTTGDETYAFEFVQSAAAALTSPDVLVRISYTAAEVAAGALAAGKKIVLAAPPGRISKRYLGLNYDGGGTTPTITVTAWLAGLDMVEIHKYYADAVVISG